VNNTFKDDLYTALDGHGVKYINVNRDASVKGSPSIKIDIFTAGEGDMHKRHMFTFDKANHMTAEEIAKVIKSYLRNRT
jgi:hypothetical protein